MTNGPLAIGVILDLILFHGPVHGRDAGISHNVWQGNDPTQELNYFIIKFPATAYKTNHVKITLATNASAGLERN